LNPLGQEIIDATCSLCAGNWTRLSLHARTPDGTPLCRSDADPASLAKNAERKHLNCPGCRALLTKAIPISLSDGMRQCIRCGDVRAHLRECIVTPEHKEMVLVSCWTCGTAREEAGLNHLALPEGPTRCGLEVFEGRKALSELSDVDCPHCIDSYLAEKKESAQPDIFRNLPCPGCNRITEHRLASLLDKREYLLGTCLTCHNRRGGGVLRHWPAPKNLHMSQQTLCGHRHDIVRAMAKQMSLVTCRACVQKLIDERETPTPDWRPDTIISEDHYAR
jgi:hypothetical protein